MKVKLKIKRLDKSLPLPQTSYPGDVAVDLHARIDAKINPGEFMGIPTGIAIELANGFEAQIRPRSGLALKHGISIVNTPGTIDTKYRGEIIAILVNHSKKVFSITKGDRICQMAIREAPIIDIVEVENLEESVRGAKGFGSSGK